ncbi:putative leader peptide [Amycolatopsis panacis]
MTQAVSLSSRRYIDLCRLFGSLCR